MKLKKEDYKILERKIIGKSSKIDLVRKKIKLPNNKIVEWYHVEGADIVAAIVLTDNNKVILNKEYRVAADDIIVEIPAGKTNAKNEKERIKELNRELQEEIGYKAKKIEKLTTALRSPHNSRRVHIYLATDLEKSTLKPDSGELIETIKLPLEKAIETVTSEVCVTTYETIAGLLLAKEKLS